MKHPLLAFIGGIGCLLALWLMLNLTIGGGLLHWQFWAVQYRDVQREVFEHSQSYVQGKISHLTRLRMSYEIADEGDRREALRRMIVTEAATVDNEDLPESLRTFITEVSTTPEKEENE